MRSPIILDKDQAWNAVRPLNEYKQTPMTQEQTGMMLNIMGAPEEALKSVMDEMLGDNVFPAKVFEVRAKAYGIEFGTNLDYAVPVYLICSGIATNPGAIVMYIHAIHHRLVTKHGTDWKEKGARYEFSEDFVNSFPMGFPDEREASLCWDNQKNGTGGNALDTQAFVNVWNNESTASNIIKAA